jgi:hypothetical protein
MSVNDLEVLTQWLDAMEIEATPIPGETAYRIVAAGENGVMPALIGLLGDRQQIVAYVGCPSLCPPERRAEAALFVARANHGLPIGNFELDLDGGEVRFKSSADYEGVGLSPILIRNVFAPAVFTMDRYLKGLLSVMFGGAGAAEAVAAIEST